MNKSGWKAGRYVIVGLDLSKTYRDNGEDHRMEEMKGQKCLIKRAKGNTIEIFHQDETEWFYFSKCDLHLVDDDVKVTYPKPTSFNPKLLDV